MEKIVGLAGHITRRLGGVSIDRSRSVKDFFSNDLPRVEERVTENISSTMFDPSKLKRLVVQIIKILIIVELVGAVIELLASGTWARLANDLAIALILYIAWEKIQELIARQRRETRARVALNGAGRLRVWDAFLFSLLWSDEIYKEIPEDRRRLVAVSYTLIGLGLLFSFIKIGSGLMPLIVSGSLVLAAVNLLSWAVSSERGETQLLQRELQLAHEVQTSLMPTDPPSVEGYDIAAVSLPAKEVGGDHFDYAFLDGAKRRFALSVFDVSGKGMPAAMAAVFTSGAYASEVQRGGSAGEILTRLNRSVHQHTKRGQFVAFLLTILDIEERTLTFADAGQTRPLWKSAEGLRWLPPEGATFPLGMTPDATYGERTTRLSPGDLLFLLSDGFTEAMNASQEPYGSERLEALLKSIDTGPLPAQEIIHRIVADVQRFAGNAPQHDDMTMVAVKVLS